MREIKFRAWDKDNKAMYYPENLIPQNEEFKGEQYEQVVPAWSFGETNERVFMQYTGLKDKNGVDLYEGDIVICTLEVPSYEFKNTYRAIVEYDTVNPCFVLNKMNGNYEYDFVKCDMLSIEVIGHIYENKNLLQD